MHVNSPRAAAQQGEIGLFEEDTKEVQIAVLLGMVAQLQLARGAKLLAPLGLNRSKFAVLQYMAEHKTATIAEMSERLEINQPGITKIVKQFVEDGLLEVGSADTDKRVKPLAITRKGLAKCGQTFEALRPAIALPYQGWSTQELAGFIRSLEKLKKWLDEHR